MEAAAAEAPLVVIADSDDVGATTAGAPFCPRWAMKAIAMDWSWMNTVSFSLLTTTSAGERRPHPAREGIAYAWRTASAQRCARAAAGRRSRNRRRPARKPWYWMH